MGRGVKEKATGGLRLTFSAADSISSFFQGFNFSLTTSASSLACAAAPAPAQAKLETQLPGRGRTLW